MSAAPIGPPQKLGKYEVRREVGRGGMGIVYEGFDPVIGRRVALKTFRNEFFDGTQSDNLLTRLRREAQAAGRLNHPNIIAVYDYGEETVKDAAGVETTTAFIAMEFVEGRSLENYFEAHERFPLREIERIMSELLDALEYSHRNGVVHRDIKPANIILLTDGAVKVADFGVARIESSTLTQVGTVLGSPSYMSPEQFMGQTVDGRSDLYSAGVVLYQILTAEIPFTGAYTTIMHRVLNENAPPPSALNVQVPKGFDAILRRAMAKRPDERYQSAEEFKHAIMAASTAAPMGGTAAGLDAGQQTLLRPQVSAGGAVPPGAVPANARAPSTKPPLRPGVLFAVLGVLVAGVAGAYFAWGPPHLGRGGSGDDGPAPLAQLPPSETAPPASQPDGGFAVISAVGVVTPTDPGQHQDAAAVERMIGLDARRQLIAKAAALYVQPSSLNTNYAILRTKLLAHSDDFITGVLQQPQPQTTQDGVIYGTMRATVSVRDVQKSLNQISRDERVEFIRNNGDPKISVSIRAWSPDSDSAAGPQPSAVAENLLKDHIRSFGFVVVDSQNAKPPADFHVEGEVRFKKLSAKLPASGLTLVKYVITSWTVKAIDAKSGEEIYHNTAIPEKQSWATEEQALSDVGRLVGSEFSQSFFLQYFDFKAKKTRLRFSGLPPAAGNAVLAELNSNLVVLNATLAQQSGGDVVIDTDLSAGGSAALPDLVQQAVVASLNRKIGATCFTLAGGETPELHIMFAASCASAASINQLSTAPREALSGTPMTSI
jgi:eukaryotic-like serine/threonine-protein kinase